MNNFILHTENLPAFVGFTLLIIAFFFLHKLQISRMEQARKTAQGLERNRQTLTKEEYYRILENSVVKPYNEALDYEIPIFILHLITVIEAIGVTYNQIPIGIIGIVILLYDAFELWVETKKK